MKRHGASLFQAFRAGSGPRGTIHPYALDQPRQQEHDVSSLRSGSREEFAGAGAPNLDFVFTVCDNAHRKSQEVCPVWPGRPMMAHRGIPDPASAAGTEAERRYGFAGTCRMLRHRITIFSDLPIPSLSSLPLQKEVDETGKLPRVVGEDPWGRAGRRGPDSASRPPGLAAHR